VGEEKTAYLLTSWKRFQSRCTTLAPKGKAAICRDPKDDAYLHLCIAAKADFLVTGDKDLLAVDPGPVAALPAGLKIVTPRQFMEYGS
jgi:predicted nucleic acid-binding protein